MSHCSVLGTFGLLLICFGANEQLLQRGRSGLLRPPIQGQGATAATRGEFFPHPILQTAIIAAAGLVNQFLKFVEPFAWFVRHGVLSKTKTR